MFSDQADELISGLDTLLSECPKPYPWPELVLNISHADSSFHGADAAVIL